ncbi:MAG: HIT family protein [Minisyncoccia bacterium]|jgi:histidine triad (HIT) family protein
MEDCIFCKIAAKESPAYVVYEDEHAIAFFDITPSAPGHTMVIPKAHAPNFLELPDAEVAPLFAAVKKVAELVVRKLGADGATVGINQGRASGQYVDHLHVHIIPRWKGDGGSAVQSVVNNKPKESLEEIKKKIVG